MAYFLNVLIFSLFLNTCRGFSNDVFTSDEHNFVKYSYLMWYYTCSCPYNASPEELSELAENSNGYGKPTYTNEKNNCTCNRLWAVKGSDQACEGCDAMYPNTGENRFFFVNSCYCTNCSRNEADYAMQQALLREDSPDDFYFGCDESPSKLGYCLCVTYSGRTGSELAGCTRDLGWYPCPFNLEDYQIYYDFENHELDVPYVVEVDRDVNFNNR